MSVLVAVLVSSVALAVLGPPGRRPDQWGGGVDSQPVGPRRRAVAGSPARSRVVSLAGAVTAVASALRSGQPPASAWRSVLGCPLGPDGVPGLQDLLEATGTGGARARAAPVRVMSGPTFTLRGLGPLGASRQSEVLERRAMAVVAAGRLAATLGAPLAPVLDRVAESISADDEVDGERRAALAGPRSTAAVLGWLPLLGVVLGAALGADPLGVMLSGGIGTASAVGGSSLLIAGRWWTLRLVRRATRVDRS